MKITSKIFNSNKVRWVFIHLALYLSQKAGCNAIKILLVYQSCWWNDEMLAQ